MRSYSKYAVRLMMFCSISVPWTNRLAVAQEHAPVASTGDGSSYKSTQSESPERTPPAIQTQPYHTLLLTNGELLSGRVYREVDTIVLTTDRGATIRIPDRQIERFCRDHRDAFRSLLSSVDSSNPSKLLELSEWALRHELFVECDETLRRVVKLKPPMSRATQSQVATIQQRLLVARDRASAVEPARVAATSKTERSAIKPVPQRRAIDLPKKERAVLASFSKHLQPLLTNQCATAGCHGQSRATGSDFVLCRPVRGRGHTSAQSIANLYATLAYIDQDDPLGSRLVTSLRELPAHNSFLVESGESQIAKVERWLASLTPSTDVSAHTQSNSSAPTIVPVADVEMVASETSAENAIEQKHDPQRASNDGGKATPTDPYDPSTFNDPP